MKTYMGLDLGGTKLLIGELDQDGNILASKSYPTGYHNQDEVVAGVLENIRDYKETVGFKGEVAAVGMGLVGMIDHRNGLWLSLGAHKEKEIPLAEILSKEFGVPAAIDNDVRSATTAELLLGCGKTSKDFIYINVGTGLAAGFVIDGHLVRGKHDLAGEVGHMSMDMHSDMPCPCDRKGCCEMVVSGVGFTAQARRLKAQYPDTKLVIPEGRKNVFAGDVFRLYDEGDALCKAIVDEAVLTLSALILDLVRVTDPDTIVLGGGLVSNGWLLEKVNAELSKYRIMSHVTGGIRLTDFNPNYVGLIGAAAVAMSAEPA